MKGFLFYLSATLVCLSLYAFTACNESPTYANSVRSISDIEIDIDFTVELSESTNDLELKSILPEGTTVDNPKWKWKIDGNQVGTGSSINIPLALSGYTMTLELFSSSDKISQITKTIQP